MATTGLATLELDDSVGTESGTEELDRASEASCLGFPFFAESTSDLPATGEFGPDEVVFAVQERQQVSKAKVAIPKIVGRSGDCTAGIAPFLWRLRLQKVQKVKRMEGGFYEFLSTPECKELLP